MWAPLLHRIAAAGFTPAWLKMRRALADPERAQRAALRRILDALESSEQARDLGLSSRTTYEEFTARCPATDYGAIEHLIEAQRAHPDRAILARGPVGFIPTSGSSAARKWIPTTQCFGRELHAAAGAWMVDLALHEPGFLDGRHYWSLSWLPDELREQGVTTDDLSLLPPLQRWALARTMAVPGSVAHLATAAGSRRATVVHLAACDDLGFVSVWSPTFFLELLDELDRAREAVAAILATGDWRQGWDEELGPAPGGPAPRSARAAALLREADRPLGAEALWRLWPRLRLIGAWDSSTSARFADQLRSRVSHARLQGKGLWATEGVVTIPFREHYPAAVTSHLLEFECLETGSVHPVWALQTGQRVRPLLTTGSGLLRHRLDDRMTVTGWLERTPCLRFDGRLGGVDLVGEKITAELAEAVLAAAEALLPIDALCLVAVDRAGERPRYVLLAEPRTGCGAPLVVADPVESTLRRIHHYALARDTGQLDPAEVVVREDARQVYAELRRASVGIDGAAKPEAVIVVSDPAAIEILSGGTSHDRARTGPGGEFSCASS